MKKLFCILFLLGFQISHAQEKATQIDQLLTMLHKQSQFNGNVLIIHQGKEILSKSYGLANRTTNQELTEHSVFELASLSKQFTAMGILLLHREGKLAYTDKLTQYFPEITFANNISIKNLLNHSSGLPEYFGPTMEGAKASAFATNKEVIEALADQVDSLSFEPNERFEYSNTNYVLLASIIEQVAKTPYHKFMQTRVFEPLNMSQTLILNSRYQPRNLPDYAEGYVQGEVQQITIPDSLPYYDYVQYLDGVVGDGMVKSTINDLRKWDLSFRNFYLIKEDEFEYLQKLDTLHDGSINHYSFGWNFKTLDGGLTMSHSGHWPGYVTYISRSIENDELMVILQNFDEVVLPVKSINELLDGKPLSTTYKREVQLPESTIKQYVGHYAEDENDKNITELSLGENALIFNSTANPWNIPFYPDSENTFFSKAPRMNLGFQFEKTEDSIKLIFLQNGKKIGEAKKMEE